MRILFSFFENKIILHLYKHEYKFTKNYIRCNNTHVNSIINRLKANKFDNTIVTRLSIIAVLQYNNLICYFCPIKYVFLV